MRLAGPSPRPWPSRWLRAVCRLVIVVVCQALSVVVSWFRLARTKNMDVERQPRTLCRRCESGSPATLQFDGEPPTETEPSPMILSSWSPRCEVCPEDLSLRLSLHPPASRLLLTFVLEVSNLSYRHKNQYLIFLMSFLTRIQSA